MLTRIGEFTEGSYVLIRNFGKLDGKKTNTYGVWSKNDTYQEHPLGAIKWFSAWRKYAFNTMGPHVILEEVCMRDISQFIVEETKAHKEAKKNESIRISQ